jgi:hypothetical protein
MGVKMQYDGCLDVDAIEAWLRFNVITRVPAGGPSRTSELDMRALLDVSTPRPRRKADRVWFPELASEFRGKEAA